MDLTEYQGKQVFREFGIPVPDGKPASSPAKAQQIAEKLGGTVVVKAQVKVGGRGKAGGVKLAKTPEETAEVAKQIIGMDIKGHKVRQVLIERAGDIAAEFYASFMLDRGAKAYLGMCSAKGGMDIEQVATEEPDYLAKVHIDPLVGLKQFHLNEMTTFGKIPREHQKAVGGLLEKLYRCFVGADAALVEVNPLAMTTLDVVAEAGGKPANFLDIGGGANAEVMANAIGVILSHRKVKSLMVNIFGGITRGDEVAKGILAAIDKLGDVKVPIVVRLDGTNAEEGRAILQKANHPKIVPAATMLDAAAKAVEL